MESKINYHALSMDEIVFDNRNKSYGAFIIRQTYQKNQLRAILICTGIFITAFSAPIILRNLGLLIEKEAKQTIFTFIPIDPLKIIKDPVIDPAKPTNPPKSNPSTNNQNLTNIDSLPPDNSDPIVQPVNSGFPTVGNPTGTPAISTSSDPSSGGSGNVPSQKKGIESGTFIEKMPEFIGGQDAFEEFVSENLIYPPPAKEDELEGTCKIRFVVNEDGSIEQINIVESSGYNVLDKAAMALVKKLPKYKPGIQNGIPVRVWCIIPISFELDK